jgi:hypothetical protein
MSSRNKDADDGRIIEMAQPLQDGGDILAVNRRADDKGNADERIGNGEDQRHMLRVGKTQELRVSRHYH